MNLIKKKFKGKRSSWQHSSCWTLLLDAELSNFEFMWIPNIILTSYSAMAMSHNLTLDAELQLYSRVLDCIEDGHTHGLFHTGTEHRWRGNQVTSVNQRTESNSCVCLHQKTPGTNYANTLFCLEHTSESHIHHRTHKSNKQVCPTLPLGKT